MTESPDITIDRRSPVPFYFQLAERLELEITSGRWQPGRRLPSELELTKQLRLSRTTIRHALGRLEMRGLVDRRKGEGTFVRSGEPGLWLLQSTAGFFQDEIDRTGRQVTSEIVSAGQGALPDWACVALDLPRGSYGATLERLRSIDGYRALYVVNHLPQRLADAALAISNPNESLYRRLRERAGLIPYGGRRTLEAVAADASLAKRLECEPGTPVAYIESVAWDEEMLPFDCYHAWMRTDRTRIDVQVSSPAAVTHPLGAHNVGSSSGRPFQGDSGSVPAE